ncbi:hypothetical protein ACH5A3_11445 [Streptomyces echinatus]|uniref:hypothetical protein n=1 Tax=Streptomyces echinatus TaxID=67293 RepID=UPI0037A46091
MHVLDAVSVAISLAALCLSVAVARRVTVVLNGLQKSGIPSSEPAAALTGKKVPGSSLADERGREIPAVGSEESPLVLAVLSASCSGCRSQLGDFRQIAGRRTADSVLVLIPGADDASRELASEVADVGRVVTGEEASRFVSALEVSAFPAYLSVTADGTVEFASNSVANLRGFVEEPLVAR